MKADEIIKLPVSLMKTLAQKTKQAIKADALQGIFQNDVSNSPLSKQYAKYKANYMQRRTEGKGETFSDKEGYFFGTTFFRNRKAKYTEKKPSGTGKRLAAYKGVSIKSNESRFSNMYLTGQTLDSLSPEKITEYGFILAFNPRDAGKIIGNRRKRNRDLVDIREKNLEYLQTEIEKELGRNIDKFTSENISINIG